MRQFKQLNQFTVDELLFTEDETCTVLKFIFEPSDYSVIESLVINDAVRSFAQAILVEAIDASYSAGFVEALFRSSANPTADALTIIKAFGRKASKHWFKAASINDLQDVKIYDFVRVHLANQFRKPLKIMALGASIGSRPGAFLAYSWPVQRRPLVWG